MLKVGRSAAKIETLNLFSLLQAKDTLKLSDAASRKTFLAEVDAGLQQALQSESTLHGIRAQLLFQSMVANLGTVKLVKGEDAGDCFYQGDPLAMPDFRAVLDSNEKRLIEVKSHFPSDPLRPLRIPCSYLDALRRYADLFDTPLKVAIYWARWNLWTLVDHARLSSSGRYSEIGLEEAMMRNEMSDLGDVTIGTRYPLELRLLASTTAPRTVDGDYVSMRVAGYEVRCAGVPVTRPEEKRLAIYLMMFGKWPETEALVEFDDDGLPTAAVHRIEPEVKNEGQGFEMVGALSSLFSKFYNFSTMEGGKVARLLRFDDPSRIAPIVPTDYQGKALPLWRFRLQPATD